MNAYLISLLEQAHDDAVAAEQTLKTAAEAALAKHREAHRIRERIYTAMTAINSLTADCYRLTDD